MRVAEAVRVNLAERLRIAVGRKLVDRGNRVVADAFDAAGGGRAPRIDAQDRADQRIEPLRLARVVGTRAAAVAESASAMFATLSPRRSSVSIMPFASMARAAAIASSISSPAMNRRAKLFGLRIP